MLDRKALHTKEPRFDHKKYLNQSVRTDSWVNHRGATIPNIVMNQSIGSSDFNADMYSGGGTKWWKNQYNKWNFTTDNFTVRGTMWIWELLINQLRASNGTVIIASCAKTKESGAIFNSGVSWDLIFDSNSETANLQPFAVDDIILAKRFTMPNDGSNPTTLIEVVGTVTAISVGGNHARITVNIDAGYSTPEGGLEFVRIGNTTDTSRQGCIVLSSDGIDSGDNSTVPFIDVYDGIDARSKFLNKDYVKVRLGRLDELTGNINEFGLWTNNLYLQASPNNTMPEADIYSDTTPPNPWYTPGTTWYDTDDYLFYKYSIWETSLTSGSLVIGNWYNITDFNIGDNFTNVGAPADKTSGDLPATFDWIITDNSGGFDVTGIGAANNNVGTIFTVSGAAGTWQSPTWGTGAVRPHGLQIFTATGTTPTNWTNGSTLKVSGWVLEGVWQDHSGAFFNAEAPSGAGFYAGSGHFGLYKDGGWRVYFDNDGDVHFGRAGTDVFWYDNSSNTVGIGYKGLAGQRMEFDGDDGEIRFYDSSGVQRILIDSSVGSGNYAGISVDGGTIEVKPIANAASGFGFESRAYSINNAQNQLGYRSEFATDNSVIAWAAGSDIVNYYARTKLVGGSMDVVGYKASVTGTTSGSVYGANIHGRDYGGYFTSDNVGIYSRGRTIGIYGYIDYNIASIKYGVRGEVTGTNSGNANIGIFGRASGGTVNYAGYFEDGNVHIENNLRIDGTVDAGGGFKDNGLAGVDGTFLDFSGNTVQVRGGIITNLSV